MLNNEFELITLMWPIPTSFILFIYLHQITITNRWCVTLWIKGQLFACFMTLTKLNHRVYLIHDCTVCSELNVGQWSQRDSRLRSRHSEPWKSEHTNTHNPHSKALTQQIKVTVEGERESSGGASTLIKRKCPPDMSDKVTVTKLWRH